MTGEELWDQCMSEGGAADTGLCHSDFDPLSPGCKAMWNEAAGMTLVEAKIAVARAKTALWQVATLMRFNEAENMYGSDLVRCLNSCCERGGVTGMRRYVVWPDDDEEGGGEVDEDTRTHITTSVLLSVEMEVFYSEDPSPKYCVRDEAGNLWAVSVDADSQVMGEAELVEKADVEEL